MKTIFQYEEVRKLLISKWDELQGDTIIAQVKVKQDAEEAENMGITEGLNRMYNLGKNHGVIEGQMKFLNELMDFFEVEK